MNTIPTPGFRLSPKSHSILQEISENSELSQSQIKKLLLQKALMDVKNFVIKNGGWPNMDFQLKFLNGGEGGELSIEKGSK